MDIAPDARVPISARAHAVAALISIGTGTARRRRRVVLPLKHAGETEAVMEVAPLQKQNLGESLSLSFSRGWLTKRGAQQAPSFERLVAADADLGHSFGSSRSSFIDMDPAELFSMRWTGTATAPTPPESDFEFGFVVPGAGGGGSDDPQSPVLASASRVFRDGRLLPSAPASLPPSAPLFRSAHSTPASPSPSPSSCSSGRTTRRRGGGGGGGTSSWKILLRYLRFLVPLYRKVRALRRRFPAAMPRPRPRVAPATASPARASTSTCSSSLDWCHGNADTAVRDAILYCKKSSGQDGYTTLT